MGGEASAGLGETVERVDLGSASSLARALRNVGVSFVRFWLQWNFVQPRLQGFRSCTYEWSRMDSFMKALKDGGLEVIPVIGCGYERMLPEGVDPDENPSAYVEAVHEAARMVVHRYRGLVDVWQIENEPNWWFAHYAAGWRRGAVWIDLEARFRRALLKSLRDAVYAEDGSASVMVNLEVDRALKDLPFYAEFCDILGLDYYPNYSHAKPVEASSLIPKAKKVLRETGRRLMICETGYPSGPRIMGYSEELQALYVERLLETVASLPFIEAVSIWRLSDSEWRSFPDQENYFGLIGADGVPKPSWQTYIDSIKRLY
ncbi:MAG: hypothetical protein ACP5QI_00395 [Candidatus Bathyarchaeia archaeon]